MTATHLLTSVVEFLVALGLKERSALFLVVQSLGWYEPTNIIFLTIAACTIYSNVTHFVVIFSPTNSKGGWNGRFCFTGPMLWWALEAKTCPERPQAIKKAKNGQSFPLENNYFPFFWTRRRAWPWNVSRKYSNTYLTCLCEMLGGT